MTVIKKNNSIPKVLLQTSPYRVPDYVVDMNMRFCSGWEYKHFDDDDIYQFFEQNPLDEFGDAREKFDSFSNGAHRADFFRYFYLYQKGGVYLDSDAVLNADIESICEDYDFVTINSYHDNKDLVFNGFLAVKPGCSIMYEALKDAYETTDALLLEDYHLLCKNLFMIVQRHLSENIKIYQEEKSDDFYAGVRTYNDDRKLILTHYCYLPKIPDLRYRFVSPFYSVVFRFNYLYKLYRHIQVYL